MPGGRERRGLAGKVGTHLAAGAKSAQLLEGWREGGKDGEREGIEEEREG